MYYTEQVMAVELWFVWQHVKWMCEGTDAKEAKQEAKKETRGRTKSASPSPAKTKKV
jgi:hypothetical protein